MKTILETQSKANHSQGPWKAFQGEHAPFVASMTGEKNSICEVYSNINGEHVANAQLIALAPELLATIQAIRGLCSYAQRYKHGEDLETYQRTIKTISTLIDKL